MGAGEEAMWAKFHPQTTKPKKKKKKKNRSYFMTITKIDNDLFYFLLLLYSK